MEKTRLWFSRVFFIDKSGNLWYNINIEKKKKGNDFMYGYNKTELYDFIQEKLTGCTVGRIQSQDVSGFVGQGISRTVLQFKEYPDIVFKIGVGEEDFGADAYECEESINSQAMEDGIAHY